MSTFAIPNEKNGTPNAEIAQLVEHNLAKVGVASSSLVFRSRSLSAMRGFFHCASINYYRAHKGQYGSVRKVCVLSIYLSQSEEGVFYIRYTIRFC